MSSRFFALSTSLFVRSLIAGALWLGCASTQTGATAEDLARVQGPTSAGATVFANECAKCHGQRGEGLAGASAILGPGALPEYPRTGSSGDPNVVDPQLIQIQAQARPAGAPWRDPFRNALDLYNFTTKHLPKSQAEAVKDADYWSVVNFILAVQGATLPPRGIDASNAGSVPIPRR